jgi:hypothetical protein
MERNETCPRCGEFSIRAFMPERVYFSGQKVEHAEYNPGLGCVVKNKSHKEDLLKRKGLVEVGNDFRSGDGMQTKFDKDREAKKQKRYDEALD